jgi:hypothetical protein
LVLVALLLQATQLEQLAAIQLFLALLLSVVVEVVVPTVEQTLLLEVRAAAVHITNPVEQEYLDKVMLVVLEVVARQVVVAVLVL